MSTSTLPSGRHKSRSPSGSDAGITRSTPRHEAGSPSTPRPTELPGTGESLTVNDLARRIAKGIVEPAFNRPGSEWHERYRELNRAAGVIVGLSLAHFAPLPMAESLASAVEQSFDPGQRPQAGARFMLGLRERIAAVAAEMGL